jgi:hypothetical protein
MLNWSTFANNEPTREMNKAAEYNLHSDKWGYIQAYAFLHGRLLGNNGEVSVILSDKTFRT